jgi:CheY-like chemotaxis protein
MPDTSLPTVLLVDDQPSNLTVLLAILEPLGLNLATARTGKEALRYLLRDDVALVLIDVEMPVMDGLETATLIKRRERSRYTPIIFITAKSTDDPAFLQAYSTGAVDFLNKPINPTVLRSKVTVFVELYEQRQRIRQQAEQIRQNERQRLQQEQEAIKADLERQHLSALAQALERQRTLLADVLVSVTEGRLRLCDQRKDLPRALPQHCETVPLRRPAALQLLRDRTRDAAVIHGFADDRSQDLITAVSEAAMNALVHGGGGRACVCAGAGGTIQVWVKDRGPGIALESLPRATLERGYSTSGTLGHGFWLMINTTDRIFLHTTHRGTTVVLEQQREAPVTTW